MAVGLISTAVAEAIRGLLALTHGGHNDGHDAQRLESEVAILDALEHVRGWMERQLACERELARWMEGLEFGSAAKAGGDKGCQGQGSAMLHGTAVMDESGGGIVPSLVRVWMEQQSGAEAKLRTELQHCRANAELCERECAALEREMALLRGVDARCGADQIVDIVKNEQLGCQDAAPDATQLASRVEELERELQDATTAQERAKSALQKERRRAEGRVELCRRVELLEREALEVQAAWKDEQARAEEAHAHAWEVNAKASQEHEGLKLELVSLRAELDAARKALSDAKDEFSGRLEEASRFRAELASRVEELERELQDAATAQERAKGALQKERRRAEGRVELCRKVELLEREALEAQAAWKDEQARAEEAHAEARREWAAAHARLLSSEVDLGEAASASSHALLAVQTELDAVSARAAELESKREAALRQQQLRVLKRWALRRLAAALSCWAQRRAEARGLQSLLARALGRMAQRWLGKAFARWAERVADARWGRRVASNALIKLEQRGIAAALLAWRLCTWKMVVEGSAVEHARLAERVAQLEGEAKTMQHELQDLQHSLKDAQREKEGLQHVLEEWQRECIDAQQQLELCQDEKTALPQDGGTASVVQLECKQEGEVTELRHALAMASRRCAEMAAAAEMQSRELEAARCDAKIQSQCAAEQLEALRQEAGTLRRDAEVLRVRATDGPGEAAEAELEMQQRLGMVLQEAEADQVRVQADADVAWTVVKEQRMAADALLHRVEEAEHRAEAAEQRAEEAGRAVVVARRDAEQRALASDELLQLRTQMHIVEADLQSALLSARAAEAQRDRLVERLEDAKPAMADAKRAAATLASVRWQLEQLEREHDDSQAAHGAEVSSVRVAAEAELVSVRAAVDAELVAVRTAAAEAADAQAAVLQQAQDDLVAAEERAAALAAEQMERSAEQAAGKARLVELVSELNALRARQVSLTSELESIRAAEATQARNLDELRMSTHMSKQMSTHVSIHVPVRMSERRHTN